MQVAPMLPILKLLKGGYATSQSSQHVGLEGGQFPHIQVHNTSPPLSPQTVLSHMTTSCACVVLSVWSEHR